VSPAAIQGDLAPQTAAGWARLRARLEADGALPAADKALLIALAAAARGRTALLDREVGRARELGAAAAFPTCASVLALCRGREIADAFAAAAGIELAWEAATPAPAGTDEVAAAGEYFAPGGTPLPPPMALLAEHAPEILVAYRGLRAGIYEDGTLEPRLVELGLFAISAADFEGGHAAVHAGKAIEAGATTAELVEAGLCAIPSAGMGSWLYSASVIDELKKGKK
jgi:alkylhydroperoxidase/carboxymuconolactone decarboxylase family protein YurZ